MSKISDLDAWRALAAAIKGRRYRVRQSVSQETLQFGVVSSLGMPSPCVRQVYERAVVLEDPDAGTES